MLREKIELAEKSIAEFRENHKDCYGVLMFLLQKYNNNYFNENKFSLHYRHLFRIIANRVQEEDVNTRLFTSMNEDVKKIQDIYGDVFDTFSTLVRRHVDRSNVGYNALARLMYGESIDYIMRETSEEENRRQVLRYIMISRFIKAYEDREDEPFRDGMTKYHVVSNLISMSKDFHDDTLVTLIFTFKEMKEKNIMVDSVSDIESVISENSSLSSADIEEASREFTENTLVTKDTIDHPDYENEIHHLEETLNEMLQELDSLESERSEIGTKQKELLAVKDKKTVIEDLNTYSNIQKGISKELLKIESALDSPYFGRVDFKEDNNNEFESFYIGKEGFRQDSSFGVIDWRMPIASVFYECENGRAKYKAPGGIYSGDVKLKRQYTIKDSQLLSFYDDIFTEKITKAIKEVSSKGKKEQKENVMSDPVLQERLKQNSDKKMKEIIETIRAEQNRIIRQPLNKVLVVQGVAGSGKSTVGLHRISYLLYNNKGIDLGKILVIAPNKVFLDYISELLPGIDVKGVRQLTFEQLSFNIIESELNVVKDEKVEFFLSVTNNYLYQFLQDALNSVSKFKGSLLFTFLIDRMMVKKRDEVISVVKDVSLFGERLKISRAEQKNCLKGNAPLNDRIKMLKKLVESRVKAFIEGQAFFTDDIDTMKKEAAAFLKSYLKNLKHIDPISVYKELYNDDNIYKRLYKNPYFSFTAQYTLRILEAGCVEREDLAALCYIKHMTDGIAHGKKYLHIFIDEAQDLSPLEFVVMKLVSQNNSMTIMGDMNQGINSHRGISNWEELINNIYADLKPQYFEILNSYRSTKDIVEFSNKLIQKNLPKAKPFARNGEKPVIEKIASFQDGINKVKDIIAYYQEHGCQTIGILAKKVRECRAVFSELSKLENGFENLNLIDNTTDKYNGGISVVPIVLSKGLEFDAVILWNASDENFSDTDFNLRMLYVAVTRPLHYLNILYQDNITSHL